MFDIKLKNGDINIENGKIVTISGNAKLEQQLLKIIITTINFYLHKNYGSEIMNLLGKPYSSLEASVKSTIRNALDYYINLQKKGVLFNLYDMEEVLYKISYLHIQQFSGDKRGCVVKIGALDGTHKNLEIDQTFS